MIMGGGKGPHSGHSGKLSCLMSPPFLSEQEYCRLCSLCSCLVMVALIGKRACHRHRHLRCRIMAMTLLSKCQFRQRCGPCSGRVAASLGELDGNGLPACCLVLATSLNQRLIALGRFPVMVKILFYLLAMGKNIREDRALSVPLFYLLAMGEKIQEEWPPSVRSTLRGVQPSGLIQGDSHGRGQMSQR
jgi:hypothetical protein